METLNVDMMAEARNAQLSAEDLLGPGAVKVLAPAKVNLFLGVGARRADGYHEVLTVMHALALHDTLHFKRDPRPWMSEAQAAVEAEELPAHMAVVGPAKNLLVTVFSADKTQATVRALDIPAAENLVVRALDVLAHRIGYAVDERITIHIEKQIPSQAGLGGGSSDAAAALLAAARFWGVASESPTLREVAAELGADVAFFLEGGCAVMEGAGERMRERLEPSKQPVVLVKVPEGVSTAQAYAALDENPVPVPSELLAEVENARSAAQVPLFNNMAPAAETLVPQLAEVRAWLADQLGGKGTAGIPSATAAADRVLLCGSGACTFALADDFAQASRIAAAARACGWWARPTTLSALKAVVV